MYPKTLDPNKQYSREAIEEVIDYNAVVLDQVNGRVNTISTMVNNLDNQSQEFDSRIHQLESLVSYLMSKIDEG